ncbi:MULTISPECIES: hypothetical protein [Paenibacillus]|uniref:RiboL-PSP-HEPN domain-containing protein n=1 Tax=Paenibacillus xylanilyticus TaxID=248903 RepID=A0A7Y6EYM8_9BACL|nr:hypothetical protein [Paenibacillus xylanilyticus]NUU78730.1 hypothetical protein [Paenibacillus xylanilyticus]
MLTKEDFKKIKKEAKLEIAVLEQEYHDIGQKLDSSQSDQRKNRRYASLVIELCSIMEQMLNQLYQNVYQKSFNSTELMKIPAYRARSNMEMIQAELTKQQITLKSGKENMAHALSQVFQARNRLIHENFTFASIVKEDMKEEQTFEAMLDTIKRYRKHLKYLRPE